MYKKREFLVRRPESAARSEHSVARAERVIGNDDILQRVERLKLEIERDKAVIRGDAKRQKDLAAKLDA